jgi:hypothetical protein
MADQRGKARPDPRSSPDIAGAGDLRTALQHEFDATGMPLRARHVSPPGWRHIAAEVCADDRHVDVHIAGDERVFLMSFWMRGVQMATGTTDSLAAVAAATATFLAGTRVRQLAAAAPFVSFGGFAEALERGEPEAITYRWQRYLDIDLARARHVRDLHDFIVAAAAEPRLRALFPFTSHQDLGLRRSVHDPQSRTLAWVRPFGPDRYLVAGPDRRQLYSPGPVHTTLSGEAPVPGALGPADAQASVTLVRTALDRHHET